MFNKILSKIEEYESIVIYGHIYPDGDCFGSQVAFKEFIKINFPSKKVYITGTGMPKMFHILGQPDDVSDDVIENSLAIAVDFNEMYRSEDQRILAAKEIIIIDHHQPGINTKEKYKINVIRPSILSACTILYDFFTESGLKINRLIRNALMFGIITDTNRFMFLEDDAKSFNVAHSLVEAGVDLKDLYQANSKVNSGILKIKGYVLSNYQIYKKKISWCFLPKDIIETSGFKGYPGYLVNQLANVNEVECWILFIQQSDTTMSVEIRSAEKNVRPISVQYGGGGHKRACGVQSCMFSNKLIDEMLDTLYEYITHYVEPIEEL